MDREEAKKRITKLKTQIDDLRFRYHVENAPEVTDDIYESLIREMKEIEKKFPDLKLSDTLDRVAGKPLPEFKKVTHDSRMLSLNDVFDMGEFEAWTKRVEKLIPNKKYNYFAELKFDGLAVSLIYKNGIFARGATRGDGFIGEDVTENLKMVDAIPLRLLPPFPKEIEIRGEIIMQKATLVALNKIQKDNNKPIFANTRNVAAGSIRQLDPSLVKERSLDFYAYDIVGQDIDTHSEKHNILRNLGFKSSEKEIKTDNISEIEVFMEEVKHIRESLPFNIDGVVVCVDESDLQNKLGVVGKAPRYAVAYKYPAEKATTIVKDITVNVGRTGVLTPLAHFEPTLVAGSTVSKSTLHNIDQIERLDVRIGDTVVIQKAGDVIPEVVMVLKDMRSGKEKKFIMPKKCPVCGANVANRVGVDGEKKVAFYCENPDCPAKQTRNIIYFVKALDIYEVGPKIIEKLQEEGLISDQADLFALTEADLSGLERLGEKSAKNIISAISDKKKPPLPRFIASLGIEHVGEETARDLAIHFKTFDNFWKAKQSDLDEIENIGPAVSQSIVSFREKNFSKNLIKKLKSFGVVPQKMKEESGKLIGKTFVLTGTLPTLSRDDAKSLIQKNGGKVSSSVSKNTSFVLAGENPGSKLTDAEKNGVRIISEKEFLNMI
jgi:DNA ligase (NAD+)